MARCGFGFGRWFAQGVVGCFVLLALMFAAHGSGASTATVSTDNGGATGAGGIVQGKVMLKGTRQGLGNVSVNLTSSDDVGGAIISVKTDAEGNFRIMGVQDGAYVCFADGGEKFAPPSGKRAVEFSVANGIGKSGVEFFLVRGYSVSGVVTDEDLGDPIEGVKVFERGNEEASAVTDSAGRYKLYPVHRGYVAIEKEGWQIAGTGNAERGYDLSNAESNVVVPLGDKLEIALDIKMGEALTISGKVTLANGDAVPNAKVTALSLGARVGKTSADGSYRVRASRNSTMRIKATAPGYPIRVSDMIEVGNSSVSGIDLIMHTGGTLSGVVLGPTGSPVNGAKVIAFLLVSFGAEPDWSAEALTDGAGRFTFLNVPTDGVALRAEMKGLAASDYLKVKVGAGETRDDLTLTLHTAHFISGRVLDWRKNPVVGARVYLSDKKDSVGFAKTGADGSYRVDGLAPGIYTGDCSIVKPYTKTISLEQLQVDRADVDFVFGEPDEKDDINRTVTFVCKVLDAATSQPIKDFSVTPQMQSLSLNPNNSVGEFRFTGQSNVLFTVTVTADGFTPEKKHLTATRTGPANVEVDFLMGVGSSVVGRVVSMGSKTPLQGVKLSLEPPSPIQFVKPMAILQAKKWATSLSDGQFVFQQVPEGEQTLEVKTSGGLVAFAKSVKVEAHKVTDVGDLEVGMGGSVRVKVIQQPGAKPLADLPLRVSYQRTPEKPANFLGTDISGKTDATGVALFENIPAKTCEVWAASLGTHQSCDLKEGEVSELVIAIGTGSLSGQVIYDGKPLADTRVNLQPYGDDSEDRLPFNARTGPDGRYAITGVTGGSYVVTAMYNLPLVIGTQDVRKETRLDIGSDEKQQDFVLPSGRMSGSVVDGGGNPIQGAVISLATNETGPGVNTAKKVTQSDASGSFLFQGLEGGDYIISVNKNAYAETEKKTVSVPALGKATPLTLELLQAAP